MDAWLILLQKHIEVCKHTQYRVQKQISLEFMTKQNIVHSILDTGPFWADELHFADESEYFAVLDLSLPEDDLSLWLLPDESGVAIFL